MSGPIVRKYGFPNHEAIFGKKEIAHGTDGGDEPSAAKPAKAKKTSPAAKRAPKKAKE